MTAQNQKKQIANWIERKKYWSENGKFLFSCVQQCKKNIKRFHSAWVLSPILYLKKVTKIIRTQSRGYNNKIHFLRARKNKSARLSVIIVDIFYFSLFFGGLQMWIQSQRQPQINRKILCNTDATIILGCTQPTFTP